MLLYEHSFRCFEVFEICMIFSYSWDILVKETIHYKAFENDMNNGFNIFLNSTHNFNLISLSNRIVKSLKVL